MKQQFASYRFLSLLLITLLMTIGVSRSPAHAQSTDDPIARINTYMTAAAENNLFSGALLIARDGEILLSAGYGMANLEWDIPNAPDTKFRIGSITKQFTAMAILILQEQGSLTVQDHICQYIDNCPATWEDITIQHLLMHTSGIPEHTNSPDFAETMTRRLSPTQLMALFIDEPLDFEPGERWSYSNSGYVVLGKILEEVSGQNYRNFLQEHIFDRLGMADTGYYTNTAVIEHRAEGYASANQRAIYIDMSIPYAAGGIYSTVEDLYRWNQALYSGEVVSQETWDAMLEAAVATDFDDFLYAYGLILNSVQDRPTIGHGGGIPGFTSYIAHLTDENMDFIILSNFETVDSYYFIDTLVGMFFDEE